MPVFTLALRSKRSSLNVLYIILYIILTLKVPQKSERGSIKALRVNPAPSLSLGVVLFYE